MTMMTFMITDNPYLKVSLTQEFQTGKAYYISLFIKWCFIDSDQ